MTDFTIFSTYCMMNLLGKCKISGYSTISKENVKEANCEYLRFFSFRNEKFLRKSDYSFEGMLVGNQTLKSNVNILLILCIWLDFDFLFLYSVMWVGVLALLPAGWPCFCFFYLQS